MGSTMDVISYTELRKNLSHSFDKVVADRNPLIITRQNAEPMVLISLQDFNAYQETAYLLSNPNNAKRLRRSISDAKSAKVTSRELIELED